MHKFSIIFISLVFCLLMADQAWTYQQNPDSGQSDDLETKDAAFPGIMMLLLGDPDKVEPDPGEMGVCF